MKLRTTLAVSGLAAALSACGDSGVSPYDITSEFGDTTTISDTSTGAKAADTVVGELNGSSTTSGMQSNIGSSITNSMSTFGSLAPAIDFSLLEKAPVVTTGAARMVEGLKAPLAFAAPQIEALRAGSLAATTTDVTCDSGSMTVQTEDTIDLYSSTYPQRAYMAVDASDCVLGGTTYNGSMTMEWKIQSESSMSMKIITGNGDDTFDAATDFTTTSGTVTEISSGKTTLNVSGSSSSASLTINSNGGYQADDSFDSSRETFFADALYMKLSGSGDSSSVTYNVTLNGKTDYSYGPVSGDPVWADKFAYSNYKSKVTMDSSYNYTYNVNGMLAKETVPAACGDGVYDIVTVTDVVRSLTTGSYSQGEITINGTTTVTFDASGIHVTVGGSTVDASSSSLLCTL